MERRRYRQLIITSLVALGAIITAVLLSPDGQAALLPAPLESVFPRPGDTVVRQTAVEVVLPVGYTLELEVDGVRIPDDEIGFTAAIGRYIWQPGPTSLFAVWDGGDHSITIRWDSITGRPDPGEFAWSFRVT